MGGREKGRKEKKSDQAAINAATTTLEIHDRRFGSRRRDKTDKARGPETPNETERLSGQPPFSILPGFASVTIFKALGVTGRISRPRHRPD